VLAVLRAEGLASCAGCRTPFVSSQPPLAGKLVGPQVAKRNYCRNCRNAKIPQRHAARDYRQRKRRGTLHWIADKFFILGAPDGATRISAASL